MAISISGLLQAMLIPITMKWMLIACRNLFLMAYFQDKTEPGICSLSLAIKDLKPSGKSMYHHQPARKQSTPRLVRYRTTYLSSQLPQDGIGQVSCNTGSRSNISKYRLTLGSAPFSSHTFEMLGKRDIMRDVQSPR